MHSALKRSLWLGMLPVGLVACGGATPPPETAAQSAQASEVTVAATELFPKGRHRARGIVRFRITENGVLLRGKITGLSNGNFGFAIHERGDCSSPDGKSAGGYFNPTKTAARPRGQLDDVNADESGVVDLDRVETQLTLKGDQSILGKSLVVHAWPYDPSIDVNAVPYVACGVIEPESR